MNFGLSINNYNSPYHYDNQQKGYEKYSELVTIASTKILLEKRVTKMPKRLRRQRQKITLKMPPVFAAKSLQDNGWLKVQSKVVLPVPQADGLC